jgi:hypothetical protein
MMLGDDVLREIERRALEIAAVIEARCGPYYAEIVDDVRPQWHLVQTMAGQELKAVRFLAARQFGVFLPSFTADVPRRLGDLELCTSRRLIFPGHVFVFVWDVLAHWRRIMSCPGVARILMDRAEHPVVVPERVIDLVQAMQFGFALDRPSRRRRRRERCQGSRPICDQVVLTCRSHWRDVVTLAPAGRIGLLHRALGLDNAHAA